MIAVGNKNDIPGKGHADVDIWNASSLNHSRVHPFGILAPCAIRLSAVTPDLFTSPSIDPKTMRVK